MLRRIRIIFASFLDWVDDRILNHYFHPWLCEFIYDLYPADYENSEGGEE